MTKNGPKRLILKCGSIFNASDFNTLFIRKQNCSSDREKLLKFKAEGREFSKILRSLDQFIHTVKGQNNLW